MNNFVPSKISSRKNSLRQNSISPSVPANSTLSSKFGASGAGLNSRSNSGHSPGANNKFGSSQTKEERREAPPNLPKYGGTPINQNTTPRNSSNNNFKASTPEPVEQETTDIEQSSKAVVESSNVKVSEFMSKFKNKFENFSMTQHLPNAKAPVVTRQVEQMKPRKLNMSHSNSKWGGNPEPAYVKPDNSESMNNSRMLTSKSISRNSVQSRSKSRDSNFSRDSSFERGNTNKLRSRSPSPVQQRSSLPPSTVKREKSNFSSGNRNKTNTGLPSKFQNTNNNTPTNISNKYGSSKNTPENPPHQTPNNIIPYQRYTKIHSVDAATSNDFDSQVLQRKKSASSLKSARSANNFQLNSSRESGKNLNNLNSHNSTHKSRSYEVSEEILEDDNVSSLSDVSDSDASYLDDETCTRMSVYGGKSNTKSQQFQAAKAGPPEVPRRQKTGQAEIVKRPSFQKSNSSVQKLKKNDDHHSKFSVINNKYGSEQTKIQGLGQGLSSKYVSSNINNTNNRKNSFKNQSKKSLAKSAINLSNQPTTNKTLFNSQKIEQNLIHLSNKIQLQNTNFSKSIDDLKCQQKSSHQKYLDLQEKYKRKREAGPPITGKNNNKKKRDKKKSKRLSKDDNDFGLSRRFSNSSNEAPSMVVKYFSSKDRDDRDNDNISISSSKLELSEYATPSILIPRKITKNYQKDSDVHKAKVAEVFKLTRQKTEDLLRNLHLELSQMGYA